MLVTKVSRKHSPNDFPSKKTTFRKNLKISKLSATHYQTVYSQNDKSKNYETTTDRSKKRVTIFTDTFRIGMLNNSYINNNNDYAL